MDEGNSSAHSGYCTNDAPDLRRYSSNRDLCRSGAGEDICAVYEWTAPSVSHPRGTSNVAGSWIMDPVNPESGIDFTYAALYVNGVETWTNGGENAQRDATLSVHLGIGPATVQLYVYKDCCASGDDVGYAGWHISTGAPSLGFPLPPHPHTPAHPHPRPRLHPHPHPSRTRTRTRTATDTRTATNTRTATFTRTRTRTAPGPRTTDAGGMSHGRSVRQNVRGLVPAHLIASSHLYFLGRSGTVVMAGASDAAANGIYRWQPDTGRRGVVGAYVNGAYILYMSRNDGYHVWRIDKSGRYWYRYLGCGLRWAPDVSYVRGGRCCDQDSGERGGTSCPYFIDPTVSPTTSDPTASPSISPTTSDPTFSPTISPISSNPTTNPTTSNPTANPTSNPTVSTTAPTTEAPTTAPSDPDRCAAIICVSNCLAPCGWEGENDKCVTGGFTSALELQTAAFMVGCTSPTVAPTTTVGASQEGDNSSADSSLEVWVGGLAGIMSIIAGTYGLIRWFKKQREDRKTCTHVKSDDLYSKDTCKERLVRGSKFCKKHACPMCKAEWLNGMCKTKGCGNKTPPSPEQARKPRFSFRKPRSSRSQPPPIPITTNHQYVAGPEGDGQPMYEQTYAQIDDLSNNARDPPPAYDVTAAHQETAFREPAQPKGAVQRGPSIRLGPTNGMNDDFEI